MEKQKEYKYQVALSFAGEDRAYADQVANCLRKKSVKVFYDNFEEDILWGKDLYEYLDNIYRKESRFCVMFLSENYAKKVWTNHERQSAQARAFQKNEDYILPVKLDDTEIPGIRPTLGYIDGRKYDPQQICKKILSKLIVIPSVKKEADDDKDIPLLKRRITEKEKKEFLLTAFQELKDGFKSRLEKLSNKNKHVKTKFNEKTQSKFITVIKTEDHEIGCKIWIDKSGNHGLSILYSVDHNDSYIFNSYNDSATVEDDGYHIYFNILGMVFFSVPGEEKIDLKHASIKDLTKYYWNRLIRDLDY
ncbi:MAG: TIR domain-containing protein [Ignavibacteriales bacterium]|nr:TIR domain-containing protein [Ignavibacteriales bacterium]